MVNDAGRVRYVLDTDTVSAHQRNHPVVLARVAASDADAVGTTVITMYEQLRGRLADVSRARDETRLRTTSQWLLETQQYFCAIAVLPFDEPAAGIYRSLVAQRLRIGTQDLRIAAIVLATDTTLVTSNWRDFQWVPGLRIEDWTVE